MHVPVRLHAVTSDFDPHYTLAPLINSQYTLARIRSLSCNCIFQVISNFSVRERKNMLRRTALSFVARSVTSFKKHRNKIRKKVQVPSASTVSTMLEQGRKRHHASTVFCSTCKMDEDLLIYIDDETFKKLLKLYRLPSKGVPGMPPLHKMTVTNCYAANLLRMSVSTDTREAREAVKQLMECGLHMKASDDKGATPLHVACRNGALKVIELLFEFGADASAVTQRGETLVFTAAQYGRVDVVKALASRGAKLDTANVLGETPLHAAAKNSHTAMVKLLLELGAEVNTRAADRTTPLHAAAARRDSRLVQLLVLRGADVNAVDADGQTPLFAAVACGRWDLVVCLASTININVPDKSGLTPLLAAAGNGHEEAAATLAKHGAKLEVTNKLGETPLLLLAKRGLAFATEPLVALGADVQARSNSGMTPLHAAAKHGGKDIVRVLVKHGADINAVTTDNETPLFCAAELGHREAVELLGDAANVDVPAKGGVTPLLVATQNGFADVVQWLVQRGANIEARADDGRTPMSVAKAADSWSMRDVREVLRYEHSLIDFIKKYLNARRRRWALVKRTRNVCEQ